MRKKEDKIVKIVKKIKKNKTTVFTVAAFTVGIAVFVVFVYFRLQVINETASSKLAVAVNYVSAGEMQKGLDVIDEIIRKYSHTPSAYRAMLMKSNYFIAQKKYDEAEQTLKRIIDNAKPDTVKPLAYPTLILIYDNTGKIDKAIETSKEFLAEYKTNYLAMSVSENLARLYELNGEEGEAQKIYKVIIADYPDTEYAQRAESKVKEM